MILRRLALIAPLALLLGCDATAPEAASDTQFTREIAGPVSLDVHYAYSGYDWGAEGDDAGTFDEDEGMYRIEAEVTLGPISECVKPWDQRADTATCSWSGPSNAWDFSLSVRNVDGVATLDVDAYAGDADSTAGSQLPIASVPTDGEWHLSFSPDNAGGSYGSIETYIQRKAEQDTASCCVVCTVGQACGDACIASDLTCHQPTGCACEG